MGVDSAVIDVAGVGYEVFCSQNTLNEWTPGAEIRVLCWTYVREDALTLFGFSSSEEKEFFLSLNKVNGIGPKMALKILSGAPFEKVIEMIEQEDVAGLSRLPKVGKKTAEQMVLSLKGKLVFEMKAGVPSGPRQEIMSALVNLGFKMADVQRVVGQLSSEVSLEEGVKTGLAALTHL